jgi:hypothetical protein
MFDFDYKTLKGLSPGYPRLGFPPRRDKLDKIMIR